MGDNKKRSKRTRKKRYAVPVILIVLVIVFRLALPYLAKNYVNQVLADIPGYYGQVKDIDIALLRGAYSIDSLYLNTVDGESEVPFLTLYQTDISVDWKSLLEGKVVSEIIMTKPEIIYVFEDQGEEDSSEADADDWSKALTDLVPIDINHLKITDGKAAFVQLTADPTIDLYLNNVDLDATNLRNVVREGRELPSAVHATAKSIGNGQMKLEGKMDLVKEIPDIDISLTLENASVTAFNDFTNHYAGVDFAEGNFNIYSEIAIADGFLTGYVKPLLKDSKLIQKKDSFFEKLWEGFVGFFKFILKNQGNNTLATKVPIEGDLNQVQTKIWLTLINIFENAWINAYRGIVDDEVDFEDAESDGKAEE